MKKSVAPGQLLPPLTAEMMGTILHELPEGTRNAVSSCYACLKANRFAGSEFHKLLESVASQSPTLTRVFGQPAESAGSAALFLGEGGRRIINLRIESGPGGESSQAAIPAISIEPSGAAIGSQNGGGAAAGTDLSAAQETRVEVAAGRSAVAGKARCCDKKEGEATTWSQSDRRRLEARRRQLQKYQGTEAAQRGSFLIDATRRLSRQLPVQAKSQLLQCVRQYTSASITPEQFAERIQVLVDAHGIVIAHDESTDRTGAAKKGAKPAAGGAGSKRPAAGAQSQPAKKSKASGNKRNAAATAAAIAASAPAAAGEDAVGGKRRANDESTTCSNGSSSDYCSSYGSPEEGSVDMHGASTMRWNAGGSGGCRRKGAAAAKGKAHEAVVCVPPTARSLPDCPLSSYLNSRIKAEGAAGHGVVVKVMSHYICKAGRFAYHKKAIFAFREDPATGTEVSLIGMYVHEFVGKLHGDCSRGVVGMWRQGCDAAADDATALTCRPLQEIARSAGGPVLQGAPPLTTSPTR